MDCEIRPVLSVDRALYVTKQKSNVNLYIYARHISVKTFNNNSNSNSSDNF